MRVAGSFLTFCAVLAVAGCAVYSPTPSDEGTIGRELEGLRPDEPATGAATTWYVVRKGDTLFSVARRSGVTVADLYALNPQITDPRAIREGDRIRVPAHGEGAFPGGGPLNEPAQTVRDRAIHYGDGFAMPVAGRIVRRFGEDSGKDPAARSRGIDFQAPPGTPIRAARGGLAAVLRRFPGYGQVIVIEHEGGVATFYGPVADVRIADRQNVSQGEVIAAVGASGRLHVRLTRGGRPVDPLEYLTPPDARASGARNR